MALRELSLPGEESTIRPPLLFPEHEAFDRLRSELGMLGLRAHGQLAGQPW
jgi:hypothetical protein